MENDLLERFPCKVMEHMCRRRGTHPNDRRGDQSWRKGVGFHYRGQLNERSAPQFSQKNRFSKSPSTQAVFQDTRTCFKCGTKGHIAKNCKIASHLVQLYKKHGERHEAHTTHVEHTETPYDEMSTNPFGDMESHTISGDTEPNTSNIFLLIDSDTIDTIL